MEIIKVEIVERWTQFVIEIIQFTQSRLMKFDDTSDRRIIIFPCKLDEASTPSAIFKFRRFEQTEKNIANKIINLHVASTFDSPVCPHGWYSLQICM